MDYANYKNKVPYSRENREEYRAEEHRLNTQFRTDLEDENQVPHDAPYADVLYNQAWSRGHSSGYASVASEYEELLELVEAVKQGTPK